MNKFDETYHLIKKLILEEYYKEPGTLKNRVMRYVKGNIGKGDAYGKMSRLLYEHLFVSVREADKMIEWDKMNTITL